MNFKLKMVTWCFKELLYICLYKSKSFVTLRYLLYTSSGGGHRSGHRYNSQGGGTSSSGGHLYINQSGKSTPYNATLWLKRLVRDLSRKQRQPDEVQAEVVEPVNEQTEEAEEQDNPAEDQPQSKRDVSLNMDLLDIVGVEAPNPLKKRSRTKRQSPGRSTLCQTTSQFITPQAALNSRGNWMFVVNEQNTARQMVKAELCA